jgi:glycosyltransferase involved in cell wall biosynthesis
MPRIYRHDLFVDCSASTASALTRIGVDLGRIRDLPVGVDRPPPNTGHSKSPTPMFLALGRLVPHKRIDLLIRMWTQVQAAVGGTLLIAGDGPESDALRRVGGPGIRFLGAVSENEKWRLLRESWALVHPAMHEGWGIVVMEAAVCGTPAVGFDVSGVRDSIVDDETGVLARSEADFVRKWALLASDEGLRTRLGRAAAIRAEQATWDRTIDTFLDVAHEAVDRHQRRFQRHPRARPK